LIFYNVYVIIKLGVMK